MKPDFNCSHWGYSVEIPRDYRKNSKNWDTWNNYHNCPTIGRIGTPEITTIIVPQLEQMDFTVQYCVQKMQTE